MLGLDLVGLLGVVLLVLVPVVEVGWEFRN
jgi:hypothetical protein